MVPMPSGAVSRITSTGKWHFSSHSAALGAMRSLAKASAVSWIAACSSVRAKCMGSGPVADMENIVAVRGADELRNQLPVSRHQLRPGATGGDYIETVIDRNVDCLAERERFRDEIGGRQQLIKKPREITEAHLGSIGRKQPAPHVFPERIGR